MELQLQLQLQFQFHHNRCINIRDILYLFHVDNGFNNNDALAVFVILNYMWKTKSFAAFRLACALIVPCRYRTFVANSFLFISLVSSNCHFECFCLVSMIISKLSGENRNINRFHRLSKYDRLYMMCPIDLPLSLSV